jgi:predicted ATP-grasp superfamily ATP-dependent carboligase
MVRIAVVTDGVWRKSLSAIRSLGKAGFRVGVTGDSWATPGFWSTYTRHRGIMPDATDDPDRFWKNLALFLHDLGQKYGAKPVLLPMEEATIQVCLQHREELERLACVLLPDAKAYAIAANKRLTLQAAKKIGIDHPRAMEPDSPKALTEALEKRLPEKSGWKDYVVKPQSGSGSHGVLYGADLSGDEDWGALWHVHGPLLLQERVPAQGRALGASLLFDRNGRFVTGFAHQRLKEFPVTGGPSTDRIGIRDEKLVADSRRLLESLNWKGVAMVEWKEDPSTGRRMLLEINPRFWGSLELAVRSGADFPRWYALAALGERLPEGLGYREGVRSRWMLPGEIFRWLSQPKHLRESWRTFFRGSISQSEEWDSTDLRGSLTLPWLMLIQAARPKHWKHFRKRARIPASPSS